LQGSVTDIAVRRRRIFASSSSSPPPLARAFCTASFPILSSSYASFTEFVGCFHLSGCTASFLSASFELFLVNSGALFFLLLFFFRAFFSFFVCSSSSLLDSQPQGGEAQQHRQLFVIPKCSFLEFFRVPFLILFWGGAFLSLPHGGSGKGRRVLRAL
jgi:hypothetical protein